MIIAATLHEFIYQKLLPVPSLDTSLVLSIWGVVSHAV